MPRRNAIQQPVPTESVEQQCLFRWADYQAGAFPELSRLHHIANGGHRNKATAGRLKAEGVKAGVPDLCLPVARCGFNGLYIEMKRAKGGGTSSDQDGWLEFLAGQGYYTAACRGWEPASALITGYLTCAGELMRKRQGMFRLLRGIVMASALTNGEKTELLDFIRQLEGAA